MHKTTIDYVNEALLILKKRQTKPPIICQNFRDSAILIMTSIARLP